MAFSMHSHSGQFCPGHAKDQLEEMVQRAIALGMHALSLTEHMPRLEEKDLYPEEIAAGETIAVHRPRHAAYVQEAVRLREKYKGRIALLVGFEADWIRPAPYAALIADLMRDPDTDFFIGSVHHVREIPIDYDRALYEQARAAAGGTDDRLFEEYFDIQHDMLQTLRPRLVGHFDLIRLFSDVPDADLRVRPAVWARIVRNLRVVHAQEGLLEVNSSALRKGLKEPYPARSICEAFLHMGGQFSLSDDSHSTAHVGLNFARTLKYLATVGVDTLYYLERDESSTCTNGETKMKPALRTRKVPLADLRVDGYPRT